MSPSPISHNELTSLPDRATDKCSSSMREIWLGSNCLTQVPKCVCMLQELILLDISYNPEILAIPVELGRLEKLNNLVLEGLCHLFDPPPSICEDTKTCVSYLRSQFHKLSRYSCMKLMLIGKPCVGKTTMVNCLGSRQAVKVPEITIGVDISKWSFSPQIFGTTFHFNVWDFAGLEDDFPIYQVFLSTRSLYLAVWNVMDSVAGINALKPFVENIVLCAPKSGIIVVGTHLDLLIA